MGADNFIYAYPKSKLTEKEKEEPWNSDLSADELEQLLVFYSRGRNFLRHVLAYNNVCAHNDPHLNEKLINGLYQELNSDFIKSCKCHYGSKILDKNIVQNLYQACLERDDDWIDPYLEKILEMNFDDYVVTYELSE